MTSKRCHVDVFLAPGEFGVYHRPLAVKTILGSCVSIVLWDSVRRIGGLNHYILPRPARDEDPGPRHGVFACRKLISRMLAAGVERSNLWAAVIGGGSPSGAPHDASVGAENTRVALTLLAEFGLRVRRQETGGKHGRKLLFNTGDGSLIVRSLGSKTLTAKE